MRQLLAILLVLFAAASASAQSSWKVQRVPGTQYTAEFPKETHTDDPMTGNGITVRAISTLDRAGFTLMVFTHSTNQEDTDLTKQAFKLPCSTDFQIQKITYKLDKDRPALYVTDTCSKADTVTVTVILAIGNDIVKLMWDFDMENLKEDEVDPEVAKMRYFIGTLKIVQD